MPWLEPLTLQSDYCSLEPLSCLHHDELVEAAQDGALWNIPYARVPNPQEMLPEINRRLDKQKQGTMLPFTVIHNETKKAIGMTTFYNIDSTNKRLNIGWTWYAKSHQRTALNTEAKFLLLNYAFETLDCIAVGFCIDVLNEPSRKAIERIGAKFEGIIRNHSILPNGTIKNMCSYSILPQEWPQVKSHLCELIKQY